MCESREDIMEETPQEEPALTQSTQKTSEEHLEDTQLTSPLSFKDFLPRLLEGQGGSEYERFGTLIDRANAFLEDHRQYDVRTCETLEVQYSGLRQVACTDVSVIRGNTDSYIRGLRIWLVPSESHSPTSPAPRIGKVDFVPRSLPTNPPQSGQYQFESLGALLGRMNESFLQEPIPGQVLTVETLDVKCACPTDGADPDACSWHDNEAVAGTCCGCLHKIVHLYVIRVFYFEGLPQGEEITMVDFVPRVVHPATSFIDDPILETFPKLLAQARGWVRHHLERGGRITNLQTVNVKASRHGLADSQRSFYIEGSGSVLFVRTLRLVYVKSSNGAPSRQEGEMQPCARTFAPLPLTEEEFRTKPQFRTVIQTMEEAVQWLQVADCRIISAESLTVKIPPDIPRGWGHLISNQSLWCRNKSLGALYLVMLRIYFDGPPKDPELASAKLATFPSQPDMGHSKCILL